MVIKIVNAWCQGQSLQPIAPDGIKDPTIYNRFANKDNSVVTGKPRNIFQKDERTFTLLPVPDETVAQSLTMRVALKPTRNATTVEDVFYEDYAEIIVDIQDINIRCVVEKAQGLKKLPRKGKLEICSRFSLTSA